MRASSDLFAVWRNTRLMVLCAVTAALYAALLLAFKPLFVLVPGVTEIRPANAIPLVCSLLFGPAAAWGSAFGNLIADFGGTLGIGSIGGFVGNFLYGYLPYKLWQAFLQGPPSARRASHVVGYLVISAAASAACGFSIAWWLALVQLVPPQVAFRVIGVLIFCNNWLFCLVLSPLLLLALQRRVINWGLYWQDVVGQEGARRSPLIVAGAALMVLAVFLGGLMAVGVVGAAYEFKLGGWRLAFEVPGLQRLQALSPVAATAPFLGALLVGFLMTLAPVRRREEAVLATTTGVADESAAIAIRGLTFTYPRAAAPALDSIDFRQEAGMLLVLTGPTGAGKSTLCRCLNGLIPHFQHGEWEGEVWVCGERVRERSVADLSRQVGMVFQDFEAQLFSTSVELEAAFGAENAGWPRARTRERVEAVLRLVGLTGFQRRAPAQLSGGEKQRLAIAAALVAEPEVVVMDEPATDLDPRGKGEVFDIARQLRVGRAGGAPVTTLIVEHELEELPLLADRLAVMEEGRIVLDGPPGEILVQTEVLTGYGVRPPQIPALFAVLGEEERPLGVEEAVERLRRKGYSLSQEAVRRLLEGDAVRSQGYGEAVVEVQELQHVYPGGQEALRGVSLTIRRGEFVALVGQNGCGKTTLARHFNGLLQPTAGEVRVAGRPTADWALSELGRKVGYVFQNPDHQIFADTVWDEVAFAPRNLGLEEAQVKNQVRQALEAVNLAGQEEADPFSLTKGERQRVAVASVLSAQPEVLILDEPTTGLDYRQTLAMMELVRRLNQEQACTVVIITHAMWVVAEYAHRCVVLQEGRILADASTREVFAQEALLEQAHLRVPKITQLGNALGFTALSVEEMRQVLRAEG